MPEKYTAAFGFLRHQIPEPGIFGAIILHARSKLVSRSLSGDFREFIFDDRGIAP